MRDILKHPGPATLRRNATDEMKRMNAITNLMAGRPVKQKQRGRGKDLKPRKREEDIIRTEIIKKFRLKGISVWRIEPCVRGKFALGDLWVANNLKKLAGWMEVKTPTGLLSDDQKEFRKSCIICNVNYWVVRSVRESLEIIS